MDTYFSMCLLLLLPIIKGEPTHVCSPRKYIKIGCFKYQDGMTLLLNDMDPASDANDGHFLNWSNFNASVHSLICRCSEKAKEMGFEHFSIRRIGECYGGDTIDTSESMRESDCWNSRWESCIDSNVQDCVGTGISEYAYAHIVDGSWGQWSNFTTCTHTCGVATKQRTRQCNNPAPLNGGSSCDSLPTQIRPCYTPPCEVNGQWSEWTEYGSCSKTCGDGLQNRIRICDDPPPSRNGAPCTGPDTGSQACNLRNCPPIHGVWSAWSGYSACTRTCGGGSQRQERRCDKPAPANGGNECVGSSIHSQACNVDSCPPVNGGWGQWNSFGTCSTSCGHGSQSRIRLCDYPPPLNGGADCIGPDVDTRGCHVRRCPGAIDGNWGQWTSYSTCTQSCDGGQKVRTRQCNNPGPSNGGINCVGSADQSLTCHAEACPVHGNWGQWASFGPCTRSCNGGIEVRVRQCDDPPPSNNGDRCPGRIRAHEGRRCNTHACADRK